MSDTLVVHTNDEHQMLGDQMGLPMSPSDVVLLLEKCLAHLSLSKEVMFFRGYEMLKANAGTMREQLDESYIVNGYEEAMTKRDELLREFGKCLK